MEFLSVLLRVLRKRSVLKKRLHPLLMLLGCLSSSATANLTDCKQNGDFAYNRVFESATRIKNSEKNFFSRQITQK